MGFLNKLGIAIGSSTGLAGTRPLPYSRDAHNGNGNGGLRAVGANRAPEMQGNDAHFERIERIPMEPGRVGARHLVGLGPGMADDD